MLCHFHHLFYLCLIFFVISFLHTSPFSAFSPFIRSSLVHITQSIFDTQVHTSLSVLCSICCFKFLFCLCCPFSTISCNSLAWNNNSHSALICDSFQFLCSISLCLFSVHAFHSIHPYPSYSLNYSCCAIHACHFTLSALDPVCCCILTASLFSALLFIHDCHSMHICHAMDIFPISHAPPSSLHHSSYLIHIISCRFMFDASVFMPSFQFTYATCLIYATHFSHVYHSSHTFICFMLPIQFSIIFLIFFLCLSPRTSLIRHASPSCVLHAQFLLVL